MSTQSPNNPAPAVQRATDAPEESPASAQDKGNKQGSHGQRAKRGAAFVLLGLATGQSMRLISNLILTRLLVPEHFGLMALVNIFIAGINMFSDLGIRQSIVQNKLGDDPRFLNTAWTIQVIRGFGVWAVACLIAFPLAYYVYDIPQLVWLLPVAAFSSVIRGFQSTKLFTAARHLLIGREMLIEFVTGVIALVSMSLLAWQFRSVWALVIGGLIGASTKTVLTHVVFAGPGNRFAWDRACLRELFSFGKWIFFGTLMMFVGTNADRLILAKLITPAMLGVYNIAFILSSMPRMLLKRLGNKVIFPAVARKAHLERHKLREILMNRQRKLVLIMALPVVFLAVAGDFFVEFAWDPRYHEAGWMTSLMALGIWIAVVRSSIGPALMAVGKPQYDTFSQVLRIVWMCAGSFIGYYYGGLFGFLIAFSLSETLPYLVTLYGRWREGLNTIWQDLWMTGVYVLVVGGLILGRYALGWGVPFLPPEYAIGV